jgi:uncharacterized damage-inducible protein DinB
MLNMDHRQLISDYEAAPALVRKSVAGLSREQLTARPIAGKWSILEVVCHLADFEPVYAGRMKWVIAEDDPILPSGNPDRFAARLAYHDRDLEEELTIIEATRRSMTRILRTLSTADFARTGRHTVDGPLSVETLLKRVTGHVTHHLPFIEEKRKALGV